MIRYLEKEKVFHLRTKNSSYVVAIQETGHPVCLHYGKALGDRESFGWLKQGYTLTPGSSTCYEEGSMVTLDTCLMEMPFSGKGDYREPAVQLCFADGTRVSDFIYQGHELHSEKPALVGLPCSFGRKEMDGEDTRGEDKVETLELILKERVRGVELRLSYSVFPDCDVMVRSARITNLEASNLKVERIMSFNLDLPEKGFDLLTLDGMWINERQMNEGNLRPGVFSIDSKKGVSGANHNPFLGLRRRNCTERSGECFGFSLIYSGNFVGRTEVSPYGMTRIQMGISDHDFSWTLKEGESLQTPEGVMTFSAEGLGGMSHHFHDFINRHVVPVYWQKRERPILVNNWEATYFDFNEGSLMKLARSAKDVGIELFVLDDGWFKGRNNDKTSLGDWIPDTKKLPEGLAGLAKKINGLGLDFGLWVEPEMVSPESDLYRAHPEWAILQKDRRPSLGRNQLMLDLSNPEVVDYLSETMAGIFRSANIKYVKWDMNRNLSDPYSPYLEELETKDGIQRQQELAHRYTLGLYELMGRLKNEFPEILFEGCSSGGNRFDMGILYYMPQIWASDNTDGGARMDIQYGTSILYPQSTVGAHVSGRPSHQLLRSTSIETRFNVAAFGLLGYELNLSRLSRFDLAAIQDQIKYYKKHRKLFQFGRFQRYDDFGISMDGGMGSSGRNSLAWSVSDESGFLLGVYQKMQKPCPPLECCRLAGLDETSEYEIEGRAQYQNIRDFGELINEFLPVKIRDGGVLQSAISERYLQKAEVQKVTVFGDDLMSAGLKLFPQFIGTGKDDSTRIMGDFGSRLYFGKRINHSI